MPQAAMGGKITGDDSVRVRDIEVQETAQPDFRRWRRGTKMGILGPQGTVV
jgi:hypothetical protein